MLDRQLQLRILKGLSTLYPVGTYHLYEVVGDPQPDERVLMANTQYLAAHDLIVSGYQRRNVIGDNSFIELQEHVITHKGLDFLQDDGGLSAILDVLTVRLHDDTVKALIAERIKGSDLPPEEKKRWLDALRELPGETTKHLVLKLVDLGLDQAPGAIAAIGKLLGA